MANSLMTTLAKQNCVRNVNFNEFLTKMFRGQGLKNTVFSFYPNKTKPNTIGVFYGYDNCFKTIIGLYGLIPPNFRLN